MKNAASGLKTGWSLFSLCIPVLNLFYIKKYCLATYKYDTADEFQDAVLCLFVIKYLNI
jgi:hypothetical protein